MNGAPGPSSVELHQSFSYLGESSLLYYILWRLCDFFHKCITSRRSVHFWIKFFISDTKLIGENGQRKSSILCCACFAKFPANFPERFDAGEYWPSDVRLFIACAPLCIVIFMVVHGYSCCRTISDRDFVLETVPVARTYDYFAYYTLRIGFRIMNQ